MPLAIELAAPWVRLLSVEEIIDEISTCLDFLVSDRQDRLPRHQSLRAVFQSSWDRLSPRERLVLQRLSVFRGGFDRAAAMAVSEASLADLAALTDHSLLQTGDHDQLGLHTVIREYAAEHLAASDEYAAIRLQHAQYFAAYTQSQFQRLKGPEQIDSLHEMDRHIDNIRAGWSWAAQQRDDGLLRQYLQGMIVYHQMRCLQNQATDLIADARTHLDPQTHLADDLRIYQSWMVMQVGHTYDGLALVEDLIQPTSDVTRFLGLSMPLGSFAWHVEYLGDGYLHLQAILAHNLETSVTVRDFWEAGFAGYALGEMCLLRKEYDDARAYLEDSARHFNAIGDRWGSTWALGTLGTLALAQGAFDEAIQYFETSCAICDDIGDQFGYEHMLREMARVAISLGDDPAAIQLLIDKYASRAGQAKSIQSCYLYAAIGCLLSV